VGICLPFDLLASLIAHPSTSLGVTLSNVEGTVRCDGDRVRITARLIEAANETHVWSEFYDLDLSECRGLTSGRWSLAVQTAVASRVAGALAFAFRSI
jgi:TolB-like protein